jgi:hypothetical protein
MQMRTVCHMAKNAHPQYRSTLLADALDALAAGRSAAVTTAAFTSVDAADPYNDSGSGKSVPRVIVEFGANPNPDAGQADDRRHGHLAGFDPAAGPGHAGLDGACARQLCGQSRDAARADG